MEALQLSIVQAHQSAQQVSSFFSKIRATTNDQLTRTTIKENGIFDHSKGILSLV